MEIIYFICILFINFFCFYKLKYLSNTFNLYDIPDNDRKVHFYKVPKMGGVILYLNYTLYFIYSSIINYNPNQLKLFIIITISFFVSLYNDKKEIKPAYRLVIFYLIFLIWIIIDNGMLVQNLKFNFNNINLELGNFSYFITPLFILIFFNALNLYDGVNLQSSSYILIFFIFFNLNNIVINPYLFLSFFLIIFSYYNFQNKIFFGDSGIAILAVFISFLIISSYNKQGTLNCEEIFVIMFLPGIDMLRVYFLRILKGKNPFKPDKNHLHHYLLKRLSNKLIFLFQIFFYLPILFMIYFINVDLTLIIILMFLLYIFVIILLNDKKIFL